MAILTGAGNLAIRLITIPCVDRITHATATQAGTFALEQVRYNLFACPCSLYQAFVHTRHSHPVDLKAILSNAENIGSSQATSNVLNPDMTKDGPMG